MQVELLESRLWFRRLELADATVERLGVWLYRLRILARVAPVQYGEVCISVAA